jgi:hypothetical protein
VDVGGEKKDGEEWDKMSGENRDGEGDEDEEKYKENEKRERRKEGVSEAKDGKSRELE